MEIIISIALEIGKCLVTPIGKCLVTPIGRECGYLMNYHSNLESLRGEVKTLFDKKDGVQRWVDAAQRNGEIIKPEVQSWLKNVNDEVRKVLQFQDEINKKRRCVYRWSLSRKADKIKQDVLQLQNVAPPPEISSTFEKGFKDFKSRKANMKEVILSPERQTPRLTSLCPAGSTFLWSSTKNMDVYRCKKLKTLGAVIPQRKKLENKSEKDSTSHDFSTSPTRSSNWCPDGCGCTPYSRPNAHRSIEILPRPINSEVTPTNLKDSNDDDNLENLTVSDCNSMEVIFQLRGPKHEEGSHSVEAFNKLRSFQLDRLPSLTRVWEMGSSQPMFTGSSFRNLKLLEVVCCNQLKYLFSSSIVKLLVSVEDIKVKNCEQMEEIVAAEEETAEIITLPKVKSIKLKSLPKLKYFCGEAYTLKLPSLELLKVIHAKTQVFLW